MILNNFWKWLRAVTYYSYRENNPVDAGFVNMSGEPVVVQIGTSATSQLNYTQASATRQLSNLTLVYGAGENNEYTANSYALASPLTASIGNATNSYSSNGTDGFVQTITGTGQNTSESAITITEVGVSKEFYKSNTAGDIDYMLIGIVKLATPITVEPNNTFSVTVEWNQV